MEKLRRFMIGRYGSDRLNWALLIAYFIWSMIFTRGYIRYAAVIFLALFWFRFLSRDVYRRNAENRKFTELTDPAVNYFRKLNSRLKDREHRYYTCPRCKQTLRVPRGMGKITITCPHCKSTIIKKT